MHHQSSPKANHHTPYQAKDSATNCQPDKIRGIRWPGPRDIPLYSSLVTRLQDTSELDAFVRDVWTGDVFLNLGRELHRVTFAHNLPDRVPICYFDDGRKSIVDNELTTGIHFVNDASHQKLARAWLRKS